MTVILVCAEVLFYYRQGGKSGVLRRKIFDTAESNKTSKTLVALLLLYALANEPNSKRW
jgi:hypothetical protein